jgi:hypothetical protein
VAHRSFAILNTIEINSYAARNPNAVSQMNMAMRQPVPARSRGPDDGPGSAGPDSAGAGASFLT